MAKEFFPGIGKIQFEGRESSYTSATFHGTRSSIRQK